MKKTTFTQILICISLVSAGFQRLAAQTVPVPEILYYKFDGTGTRVPNLALTPPVGTDTADILGAYTQGSTGLCGGALIGSGNSSSTDYVNTHWAPNLGGSSWSISFWTSGFGSTTQLWYIFGDANTNSFRCFTNGVAGPNNWILRGAGLTDVTVNGGAISTPTMTTFVYDISANNVKAYLNGVLVNTVAQTAPSLVGTGPFKVGGYATNYGNAPGSLMDEFRVYNRALNSAEVLQLYQRINHDTVSMIACDSVFTSPSGNQTWNTAGVYNDTLTNIWCGDSILNITLSFASPSAGNLSATSCGNYTSPSGNHTWSVSGTYMDTITNAAGCDSVLTIDLTVNTAAWDTLIIDDCDLYVSPSGNYTWSSSGIYDDTLHYASGCDSIIYSIDLTIRNSSSSSISPTACGSYTSPSGNFTWTSSGLYIDVLTNAVGCDSNITVNLTINNANVNVTQAGPVLTAAAAGAAYQWIDCSNGNQPIAGATSQSYTAITNGDYAVIVTQNGCTDTSSCFSVTGLGGVENMLAQNLHIYPNPTDGNLNISLGQSYPEITIELVNNLGQVIRRQNITYTPLINTQLDVAPGLYYLRITAGGEQVTLPVSKR